MESTNCMGLMAVVAVSGSVVLVAHQLHKRLVSEFMKKVQSELGITGIESSERYRGKKKVRFADDVVEPSSNNEEYRRRRVRAAAMVGRAPATVMYVIKSPEIVG